VITASPADEPAAKQAVVLVVEDEVLVRLMLADELREHGYVVVEAASGDEAVNLLRGGVHVGLVVTDVRMPGNIDGVGLARFIRGKHPDIKIIMVSGHMTSPEAVNFVDGFLSKPYDLKLLVRNIELILARSSGMDPVE